MHDSKGRALYTGLTSLAEGADDPELARLYLDTRDLLFPEGLAIVTRSYAYEAGAIEALERRVTPESLLARTTRGGTGTADVDLRAARGQRTVDRLGADLPERARPHGACPRIAREPAQRALGRGAPGHATREGGSGDPDSDDPAGEPDGDDPDPGERDLPPADDIIVAPTPGDDLVSAPSASALAPARADLESPTDA